MQNADLIGKIQKLPPEILLEVEHFVDFLSEKQHIKRESENGLNDDKTGSVNLRELGISEEEAAKHRAVLTSFTEDWERPEMEVYDKL